MISFCILLSSDLFLDHELIIRNSGFYVFFAANLLFLSCLLLQFDVRLILNWVLANDYCWPHQYWAIPIYLALFILLMRFWSWEGIGYASTLFFNSLFSSTKSCLVIDHWVLVFLLGFAILFGFSSFLCCQWYVLLISSGPLHLYILIRQSGFPWLLWLISECSK